MAFVAFLDTCVLYPPTLRDVLLTISEAGVCQIRWSSDVLDELQRILAERADAPSSETAKAGARYLRNTMEDSFPDALVDRRLYEKLITAMQNDSGDRHVLAAAIAGRADVLVTSNVRHFPRDTVPDTLQIQDPDTFLCFQFELSPGAILETLEMLSHERHIPLDSVDGIIRKLRFIAPRFSERALSVWHGRT